MSLVILETATDASEFLRGGASDFLVHERTLAKLD